MRYNSRSRIYCYSYICAVRCCCEHMQLLQTDMQLLRTNKFCYARWNEICMIDCHVYYVSMISKCTVVCYEHILCTYYIYTGMNRIIHKYALSWTGTLCTDINKMYCYELICTARNNVMTVMSTVGFCESVELMLSFDCERLAWTWCFHTAVADFNITIMLI